MLDRYTHREPRLQKNLFAPGPHRIQAKATKHKSSILDKFSFSLSHLRYQIKYKINYKKTGRPGWDDQFNFARDPQPFGKLRDLFRLVSLSNHAQDDTAN